MSATDERVMDQDSADEAAASMPPDSLTTSDNTLIADADPSACAYQGPDMSAAGSAKALSDRMRALAKRPRGSTARRNLPAYLRQQMDGIESLRDNAVLKRFDRELRAELQAAGLANVPEALVDVAVRCRAVYELVESVTFKETGGPVHRRKRALHQYVEQRRQVLAEWLNMRERLGLDQTPVSPQPQPIGIDADLTDLDRGRRIAYLLQRGMTAAGITMPVTIEQPAATPVPRSPPVSPDAPAMPEAEPPQSTPHYDTGDGHFVGSQFVQHRNGSEQGYSNVTPIVDTRRRTR